MKLTGIILILVLFATTVSMETAVEEKENDVAASVFDGRVKRASLFKTRAKRMACMPPPCGGK